jgi:glutaredoxin 3
MSRVTVYSTANCPFCLRAKTLLDELDIAFDEVRIDIDPSALKSFTQATNGARTVPQIMIDGRLIGGFSELTGMHRAGELDNLARAV